MSKQNDDLTYVEFKKSNVTLFFIFFPLPLMKTSSTKVYMYLKLLHSILSLTHDNFIHVGKYQKSLQILFSIQAPMRSYTVPTLNIKLNFTRCSLPYLKNSDTAVR